KPPSRRVGPGWRTTLRRSWLTAQSRTPNPRGRPFVAAGACAGGGAAEPLLPARRGTRHGGRRGARGGAGAGVRGARAPLRRGGDARRATRDGVPRGPVAARALGAGRVAERAVIAPLAGTYGPGYHPRVSWTLCG